MKALLENREEKLTPGQFLNISLSLDTLANAVVVPAEAVQQGPEGNFLFVVSPDNTVEPRKIEVSGQLSVASRRSARASPAGEWWSPTASSGWPPALVQAREPPPPRQKPATSGRHESA
jgi:hypothetical protein